MEPHDCRMILLGILLQQQTTEQHSWWLCPEIPVLFTWPALPERRDIDDAHTALCMVYTWE